MNATESTTERRGINVNEVISGQRFRLCAFSCYRNYAERTLAWSCFVEDRKFNHGPYGLYETRDEALAAARARAVAVAGEGR